MALVSVIMNIRNGAPYLREAIESVLAQSFSEWELIAWDDCSTDDSAEIVRSYRDSRILYRLSPEDTPLGRARSLACRQARGEWIAFLDQDDVWAPRKLELQLHAARRSPRVGLVYGRTLRFGDSGLERDFDHRHEFRPLPQGEIFEALFQDSCFLAMSSAVFRATALREAGDVPPDIQMAPDYYYYTEVCSRFDTRAVEEVVCRYRVHGDNMTRATWVRLHEECLWLVERWSHRLDPRLVARRRRVHHTLIAVNELRRMSLKAGLSRLLWRGSVAYLLSRLLIIPGRSVRRRFQQPEWRKVADASRRSRICSGAMPR